MVEYTTKESRGGVMALWIAGGVVALILLYALFAGESPETGPAGLSAPIAEDAAPAADVAAPAVEEAAPAVTE